MSSCWKIQIVGQGFLDLKPNTNIVPVNNLEELTEIDSIKISGAFASSVPAYNFGLVIW